MRIVFLQDDFPPQSFGGAGISVYELALGMKDAGHEVFVITTCRKESEAGEADYEGLKVFKIASNYNARWRWYGSLYNRPVVREVERLFKDIRPDVVHANNIHFHLSYHCLKVAKQHAKVVAITFRDVMSFNFAKLTTKRYLDHFDCRTTWRDHIKQAGKRWNPFRNPLIKRYLKYADVRVAVSDALRKALEQNDIHNVEVIHTGIDVSAYSVPQNAVADFKAKYGLENKKVLLFAGRLSESKGGRKVVRALSEITYEFPDTILLIAGEVDAYAEEMKQEAERLGIANNLVFTGWIEREEMKATYALSDIVLVPSLCLDSFPRTVLEGMASGKSVIATCYGGASEAVIDDVTGYVVNPRHSEKIVDKALELLKEPEKAGKFGKAGRERIKNELSLNGMIKGYLDKFEKMLYRTKS